VSVALRARRALAALAAVLAAAAAAATALAAAPGDPDPGFDVDGRATVDFAGSRDTALGLGLGGGRVVLAGSSDIQVAVARLLG